MLEDGANYTCCFWADGGVGTYDITSLKAIERGEKPSIAYHAVKEITASSEPKDVTLTHAVAKVVLHETGTLAAGDKVGVSFTLPKYSFNADDGSLASDGTQETVSGSFDITSTTTTGQVGWLYVFAPSAGYLATVTLSYTTAGSTEKTKEVSNVPLKPNHRTVLKGEFAGINGITKEFIVSLEKDWEGNYRETLITTAAGQIDANPALIAQAINADGSLVIEGPVNTADIVDVGRYGEDNPGSLVSIDLSATTGLTEISEGTFYFGTVIGETSSLTSVVLPYSLETIGVYAFWRSGLVEIVIPDNVTSIGTACFDGCSALERVTLPENLTVIKDNVFDGCSALKEITIPAGVEVICIYSLYCTALEALVFEGDMQVVPSNENIPNADPGKLVINRSMMGSGNDVATGFNVFLPNISDETTAATYKTVFTTAKAVYYNYTGGDKTDTANYEFEL